jgi:hypothetical protein
MERKRKAKAKANEVKYFRGSKVVKYDIEQYQREDKVESELYQHQEKVDAASGDGIGVSIEKILLQARI